MNVHIKAWLLLCLHQFLTGCSNVPTSAPTNGLQHDWMNGLTVHPEFSPLVPREGRVEYQVVWYRSWRPMIYLKAYSEKTWDGEVAYVSFAFPENGVGKLVTKEITMVGWRSIESAVKKSRFWDDNHHCEELAYKEQRLYRWFQGQCEWIGLMDGATVSMSGSKDGQAKGVVEICNELDRCSPYDDVVKAIINTVDKANLIRPYIP